MCTQSVGLLAGELERRGIATVCIALVRETAERVQAPRSLVVPFDFGLPLGRDGDAALQTRVMMQALALLALDGPGPLLAAYAEP